MMELGLPPFKTTELDFIQEYIDVLTPIAIAIDRLQGETDIFYGELLPTLLTVETKLQNLKNSWRYVEPLLNTITAGFQKRFSDLLNLNTNENHVRDVIIASVSHPYFKLRWITINNEWNHEDKKKMVKEIIVRAANFHLDLLNAVTSSSASEGDDYFGFRGNDSDSQPRRGISELSVELPSDVISERQRQMSE